VNVVGYLAYDVFLKELVALISSKTSRDLEMKPLVKFDLN